MVMFFTSCSSVQSEEISQNVSSEEQIVIPNQIKWADCFKQEESHYLVFFHSETCNSCKEIIGDVIAFSNANVTKTYFLDINGSDTKIPINRDVDGTIGATSIEGLYIAGTPTIVEFKDGAVTANVGGKDPCLSFLNDQRLIYSL